MLEVIAWQVVMIGSSSLPDAAFGGGAAYGPGTRCDHTQCSQGNDAVKALQLLVELQRRGLEQDVITYSALISARAEGENNAARALQLLVEMQRQGLEPDVFTYSALFNACAKGSIPAKSLRLLKVMQRKGLEPDGITYRALISACEKVQLQGREGLATVGGDAAVGPWSRM